MPHPIYLITALAVVVFLVLRWFNSKRNRPHYVGLPAPEQRELTIVFTNLTGYVPFCERAGNEAAATAINEHMKLMVPIIRRHRGYIKQFLGDGIMFFFGAPLENPNHAPDAVAAALEMQSAQSAFNQRLASDGLPALPLRIGICTGRVVVGDVGDEGLADYTVMGDNVNLARRLEAANKKTGTAILISERTAELLGGRFALSSIESIDIIGSSKPIRAYEPTGTLIA